MNLSLTHSPIILFKYYQYRLFLILLILSLYINSSAQEARVTNLFNEGWKFHKGDIAGSDKLDFNDGDWKIVNLPHDWSIEGPFDQQWASATAYLPAGIGWYRKAFVIAPGLRSKNMFLYFDGVYKNSEVWINGHYLGKRPNGFISFQYEITKYINATGSNTLAVKVDHSDFADSRFYNGSGIYRNVYLVATDPVHIDLWGIHFITPSVNEKTASAKLNVSILNQSSVQTPVLVKAILIDASGKTVANARQELKMNAHDKGEAHLSFSLGNPALWSIDRPNLYKLQVNLFIGNRKVDDETEEVGFRWFIFDANKGFFLNGKSMKLKGVCIHDDAGALGVAVPEEVWIRRLQILKEAGCNSIRMSHNPHADFLYKLTDRMGFLVMDESFDEWELGKNKWIKGWNVGQPGKDGYHSDFKEWAERDIKDMVLRNINRPSIFMWSIGNEIDYPNDPYTHEVLSTGRNPQIYGRGYTPGNPQASRLTEIARQLTATVKKYDTTRPVTAALAGVVMSNEVGFPETLDIVGYNYQEYRYPDDHKKFPGRFIYGSENGMPLAAWNAVADNEYIAGQYLWTGIDYMGEARTWPSRSNQAGLIDLAGFPKSDFYFRQSLWTDQPMIYAGTASLKENTGAGRRNLSQSWNYNTGDSVAISCFTNCDEAELFINGSSLGRKQMADVMNTRILTWKLLYQPGELLVKGYKKGKEINHYSLKTTGEPYAIKAMADRSYFSRGKKQLAQIEINVVDKDNNVVNNSTNEVIVNIEGPAILLGLESGSLSSHEDYKANKRLVLHGKLIAYIQSQQKAGPVKITIASPGLQSHQVLLPVQ